MIVWEAVSAGLTQVLISYAVREFIYPSDYPTDLLDGHSVSLFLAILATACPSWAAGTNDMIRSYQRLHIADRFPRI